MPFLSRIRGSYNKIANNWYKITFSVSIDGMSDCWSWLFYMRCSRGDKSCKSRASLLTALVISLYTRNWDCALLTRLRKSRRNTAIRLLLNVFSARVIRKELCQQKDIHLLCKRQKLQNESLVQIKVLCPTESGRGDSRDRMPVIKK